MTALGLMVAPVMVVHPDRFASLVSARFLDRVGSADRNIATGGVHDVQKNRACGA